MVLHLSARTDLRDDVDAAHRLYLALHPVRGARWASAGLAQISPELEESARIHGASWLDSLRRIVIPLLKLVLTVGWILIFIEIIRSLSLSILLYSNDSNRDAGRHLRIVRNRRLSGAERILGASDRHGVCGDLRGEEGGEAGQLHAAEVRSCRWRAPAPWHLPNSSRTSLRPAPWLPR